MRRIKVKSLGRKPKEYCRIVRFSDDKFGLLGKQKNSIVSWHINNSKSIAVIAMLESVEKLNFGTNFNKTMGCQRRHLRSLIQIKF